MARLKKGEKKKVPISVRLNPNTIERLRTIDKFHSKVDAFINIGIDAYEKTMVIEESNKDLLDKLDDYKKEAYNFFVKKCNELIDRPSATTMLKLNDIDKKKEYKNILKLVNECIYKDEYINYGKIFLLKEKYISNNQNLTKYEKLYLKNKLERSYEEFIINISKGNINIFKYKKNDIKYEHIYRTIVAYMKNNYKKNKIKKNIIHLLNGSKNIKNKDNINYLIDIM